MRAAPPPFPADRSLLPPGRLRLALVAFALASGALRTLHFLSLDRNEGRSGTLAARLVEEATAAAAGLAVGLLLVEVVRRVPLTRWREGRVAALYVALFPAFTLAHTTLMLLLRRAVAAPAGLELNTAFNASRFLYEGANDAVTYVLALVAIAFAEHLLQARARDRRAAALERSLLAAELQGLRLSLQPHFLFNALNTIADAIWTDPARADALLGQLAELLRASLRTTHVQEVPLADELALLARYTGLLEARFGDRFGIAVEVPEPARTALVPSLLLQPLVENAVRHGGVERTGRGRVTVSAAIEGETLALRVHDDGPGAAGDPGSAAGTGLRATAQRLALLYGDGHAFAARNADGGGFEVVLRLPHRPAAAAGSAA